MKNIKEIDKPEDFLRGNSKEAFEFIDDFRESLESSFKKIEKLDLLNFAVENYHSLIFNFSEQMKKSSDYFSNYWCNYWCHFWRTKFLIELKNREVVK